MQLSPRLLAFLVLAGSLAGSLPARADDASARRASADELLKTMHTQQMMERATDRIGQSADKMMGPTHSSATPAEEAAFRDSLRQQAAQMLKEELRWETLEPILAQSYADDFTEPELKQLTDFYKSPVGQKLLDKQPELTTKLTLVTQQKVRTAMPMISQKLQASIQKFQADHPVKDAPAAPGGFPLASPPANATVAFPPPVPRSAAAPSGTAALAPAPMPPAASPAPATPTPAGLK